MFIHIGIDTSKESLDLCWLQDVTSGKRKSRQFKNKRQSHENLAVWLPKIAKSKPHNILITIEPTGVYHEALIYFLHSFGFKIFLANPGKAKQHAKSINITHKTDKSDAFALASYGHDQFNRAKGSLWEPEATEVRELKSLIRRLEALEKDYRREKNRLESSEISDTSERVMFSLKGMIKVIEEEIDKLKNDIDDHIKKHPDLEEKRKLLKTIVGVGDVIAREMVYLLSAKKFSNAKQLAAYLGLIPKLRESGTFKGRSCLTKTGPSRIRAKLYMAAIVASQHNKQIKAQKERLLANGKNKMQALGAAMRKLVQICFGVVKNKTEYKPHLGLI